MRDKSEANEDAPYDDYRVIVDLEEWTTYRVRDYGNKKGWVLVCELIPPYHEIAIAEAGEDKNSFCEAYIINDMFLIVCKQPQVASMLQILLSTFAVII